MQDYTTYFKDKKITVMGLGLLGRGVGDTAFLAECGAELIVTDKKTEIELQESFNQLKGFTNIVWRLGEHCEEDFIGRDMILKASGVPLDSKYIDVARKDGAEIVMSGALFAKLSGVPIIGVTGTRGKSTVTHMIHHVLTHTTEGGKVLLGGNVRGVSNLQLLKEVEEDSLAVMELDSWQLQGFGEMRISPQIAVFTNFMEDHMNYYKGDMETYFADKAHIFMHQEDSDVLITTPEVFMRTQTFSQKKHITIGQEVKLVDASMLPEDCLLTMPGEHNRLNAVLALEALRVVGLTDEEIYEGLASFPGVPGRLEYMGTIQGVKVYNDNNATTPMAVVRGMEAVVGNKNIILVAGGAYKEVNPDVLITPMQKYCKKVCLLAGTGTDAIKDDIECEVFDTLKEAVEAGLAVGEPGDVLLFSPGFASFGMFVNEYERNDIFVEIIKSYDTE